MFLNNKGAATRHPKTLRLSVTGITDGLGGFRHFIHFNFELQLLRRLVLGKDTLVPLCTALWHSARLFKGVGRMGSSILRCAALSSGVFACGYVE